MDIIKPTFAGGIMSPELQSREDIERYSSSVEDMENFYVDKYGNATNRPGTVYIGDAAGEGRLIPFQFSYLQGYVLEFTNNKIRVLKDGGLVVYSSGPSAGNPVEVVTTYTTTQVWQLEYTQSADVLYIVHPSHPVRKLTRTAHDAWTLTDATISSSATTPTYVDANYTGSSGTTTDIYYQVGALDANYSESTPATSAVVSIDTWASGKVVDLQWNPLVLSGTYTWAVSGSGTSEYYCSADPCGQEPDKIYFDRSEATKGTLGSLTAGQWAYGDNDSIGSNRIYVRLSDSTDPDTKADYFIQWQIGKGFECYKNQFGYYGWMGTPLNPWFQDVNILEDSTYAPISDVANDFSTAGNYPAATAILQQRLLFARSDSQPATVWGSQIGDLTNFGIRSPLSNDDAVSFTLASERGTEIRYLVPLDKMLVLTSESEWIMDHGPNSDVLTPTSIDMRRHGYEGCAQYVRPVTIGKEAIFATRSKQTVRAFRRAVDYDGWETDELSVFVPSLFEGKAVKQMAYAQHPHSVLWCVMDDGSLLSLSYNRQQQMWAWARHSTAGQFESIASLGTDGNDEVYVIARRLINGSLVRYLEYLSDRQVTDIRDAVFCDSSLTYDDPKTITAITNADPAVVTVSSHGYSNGDKVYISGVQGMTEVNNTWFLVANKDTNTFELTDLDGNNIDSTSYGTFTTGYSNVAEVRKGVTSVSGLSHLEGEDVDVLADGMVIPDKTVASGAITLPSYFATITVGLPISAHIKTLRANPPVQGGTAQGRKKAIKKVILRVKSSILDQLGTENSNGEVTYRAIKQRQYENWREGIDLLTGDVECTSAVTLSWSREGYLHYLHEVPTPVTISGIIMEIDVGAS